MLDKETQQQILDSILKHGTVEPHDYINENIVHVLDKSSGKPRLQSSAIKKLKLILSQPNDLDYMNPFQIRCAVCKGIISYPCWYMDIKYAVNHFHYFVCFDSSKPSKPTCKCLNSRA